MTRVIGIPWTHEEDEQLLAFYHKGDVTRAEMRKTLTMRTVHAIGNRAFKLGIIQRQHRAYVSTKEYLRYRRALYKKPTGAECSARTCLKCRNEFQSTGIGNRLCPSCRKESDGYDFSLAY